MRYQPLIGLYNSGGKTLASGVLYATSAPTDLALNSLGSDDNGKTVYEYVRISGTCTVGSLLYLTGTAGTWVVCTGTGAGKPYGISLVAPTASGGYSWIQKYGRNTSIQITTTFGGSAGTTNVLFGGESAAQNFSSLITSTYSGAGGFAIGKSLTAATGSQTMGFIELL